MSPFAREVQRRSQWLSHSLFYSTLYSSLSISKWSLPHILSLHPFLTLTVSFTLPLSRLFRAYWVSQSRLCPYFFLPNIFQIRWISSIYYKIRPTKYPLYFLKMQINNVISMHGICIMHIVNHDKYACYVWIFNGCTPCNRALLGEEHHLTPKVDNELAIITWSCGSYTLTSVRLAPARPSSRFS